MRICLFLTAFLPKIGGAENLAEMIASGLRARGHEVLVLTDWLGKPPPPLPYPVWHYRHPPQRHWWPELFAWALLKAKWRWKFDVVMTFNSYPVGYAATWLKRRLGMRFPVVIVQQGGDLNYDFEAACASAHRRDALRQGISAGDRVVACSGWATGTRAGSDGGTLHRRLMWSTTGSTCNCTLGR